MTTPGWPRAAGPLLVGASLLLSACSNETTTQTEPSPGGTSAADITGEDPSGTPSPTGPERSSAASSASGQATAPTLIGSTLTGSTPSVSAEPASSTTTEPDPEAEPVPVSAADLAEALSRTEAALRAPDLGPGTAARWGRRQQQLYRILSINPNWADEVVNAVAPSVREPVVLNWQARQALSTLLGSSEPSATLPAWRIAEPAPAEELLRYYHAAAEQTGVAWEILAAINLIETRMGRINGVSTAGAVGPMQFLPSTWEECCTGDPAKPADAIKGAADYLIDRGAADDLNRALFGYNNSDNYVAAVRAYAAVMALDERAYRGYHAWEVYYRSADGLVHLPVGYEQPEAIDAAAWIEANPDRLVALTPSG